MVSSESEKNVKTNVLDIIPSSIKKIGGKKVPMNIHVTPLDSVSFHSEESVKKWKFACQRRVSLEK